LSLLITEKFALQWRERVKARA